MNHSTIQQKAADAINVNGLHTHATDTDFRSGAALEQAPSIQTITVKIALFAFAGMAIHKGSVVDFTKLQAFKRWVGVCS